MKRSTIIIIIGLIVSIIVVPIVVLAVLSGDTSSRSQQLTNNPPLRSDNQVASVIAKSNQYLHDSSGDPTFKLLEVKRLANNWYMAWIDSPDTKVLINDPSVSADYMTVMLGPSTTFDSQAMYTKGIPSNVYGAFIDAKLN